MSFLFKLLNWWKLILAGLAGAIALFFKWRSDVNENKAHIAESRVGYLEDKASNAKVLKQRMNAVKIRHEQERENLVKKRADKKRGGGLGKW